MQMVAKGGGVSQRGLPSRSHLQDSGVYDILRTAILKGKVSMPETSSPTAPLQRCIRAGWLHHMPSESIDPMTHFTFASTWHKRYVECLLYGNKSHIHENSLIDFVTQIIIKFSLTIGNSSQSVPEAQFQDGFYRAALVHTHGGVLSFPEFGNKIDFFIPSKKWGIELLCNGDRIATHAKRFTQGEYHQWIASGILVDYVIIDFHTKTPHGERGEFPPGGCKGGRSLIIPL